jgi:uncharacterized membrane protein YgcG
MKHGAAVLTIAGFLAAFGNARLAAQESAPPQQQAPSPDQSQAPYANLSEPQLERVVAPIALYPDALVAQILAAATFPSQIVDAEAWLQAHPGLSPADLGAQVDPQPWDASVKALVQFPNVLANLASNLGWTSELGDAYYNQPQDVMNAVQVMRQRAQRAGNLESSPQQTEKSDNGRIQIAPASPNIVYVPAYDPWAVYGYPLEPWPYWINTPGIWWGGPGIYFGMGFPIAPFFGFGWGWHAWGLDWYHQQLFYQHGPWVAHGPDFFDRRGYYGGHPDFARGYRGNPAFHGDLHAYRGYTAPHNGDDLHSGPFTGYNHGGVSRSFSAHGQSSMGGFQAGGFHGGGFHGGGGAHR